ncbi:amino acid synthesis protein [Palleronia aestuarii]|uniref:Amino acid synthesis protein n=1 Tax=Palleronia aestuarii TaxID=568105 RepID=A0A2W7N9W9_9RHOB|nr:amino acid synthesis family protein [Palleronia aestuarii]PZX17031.1 amino acid synthesis protein [Palleronia aestuarii]
MPDPQIRKTQVIVETIHHEFGPPPDAPVKRGASLAVIANPFAGRFEAELTPFMDDLKPLGLRMAQDLIDALGGDAGAITSYGKGAIVGTDGELEHGALWHVPGGYAMRELIAKSHAIVPSSKKVGVMGARLDVPISHADASYVRSHFDAMEVGIPDAPRPGEILLALVMTTGGRIHARMGGLAAEDVKGEDGLR